MDAGRKKNAPVLAQWRPLARKKSGRNELRHLGGDPAPLHQCRDQTAAGPNKRRTLAVPKLYRPSTSVDESATMVTFT